MNSKETSSTVSADKTTPAGLIYLELVNESVKDTNHGPPATVRLTSKTMNTLQGISTLHTLPNYFAAHSSKKTRGLCPSLHSY